MSLPLTTQFELHKLIKPKHSLELSLWSAEISSVHDEISLHILEKWMCRLLWNAVFFHILFDDIVSMRLFCVELRFSDEEFHVRLCYILLLQS